MSKNIIEELDQAVDSIADVCATAADELEEMRTLLERIVDSSIGIEYEDGFPLTDCIEDVRTFLRREE